MLKIATAEEMQEIDRATIEKYGLAGAILMERAGLSVVSRINDLFFNPPSPSLPLRHPPKVIILAGGGNNGGDGLVIARVLHNQGREVEVCLTARPENLKGDAKTNYDTARKFGVRIYPISRFLKSRFSNALIVDALLGTGLSKEVREPLCSVIKKINGSASPVVSVDIPSGISSDTGLIMGSAVKAHCTLTFGLPKRGHFLYPGAGHTGKLYIEDIGFPQKLLRPENIRVNLVQKEDAASLIPDRPKYSHKGTYGHVLLVAGSRGKTGAALMAARACLATGAGLVTIGVPATLVNAFQSRVTEEMILPLPDKGNGTLSLEAADTILKFITKRANVLAIGPGISIDSEISELVSLLVTKSMVPVVVDADGINAIAGKPGILKKATARIILTPHPGEMARLAGKDTEHLRNTGQDSITTAVSFARATKTYLVLKGAPTVTAHPDGRSFINSTGNPGMATAGTGDVLTGMISAFLAQKLSLIDASILGVYIHGYAGDIAAEEKGERSLIASDIIKSIPLAFISILNR